MSEDKQSGLVRVAEARLPKFVEDAYESIEKMEKFAEILLNSKLVPNHFYEQLPDRKPDFSKGKVPAVVAVLIQGYQLQLPPLTALQHIIPVNGLLSIKGDLAKSMIFNSGKLKSGSWREEEHGNIDNENLVVQITATRSDNGQTLTRSFSVDEAKRAGLWIPIGKTQGTDGYKYLASAWWKYPARMIMYRALGFIARDLFPDVMNGLYTTEEAADIPTDQTITIDQGDGIKLTIPDSEFTRQRGEKMTSRALDKIEPDKFTPVDDGKKDAAFTPQKGSAEMLDGKIIKKDGVPVDDGIRDLTSKYTLKGMEEMPTPDLMKIIYENQDMIEAVQVIPGKNTNRKLREIIFAYQKGNLSDLTTPFITESNAGEGISPNKDFENQGQDLIPPSSGEQNKYGIEIPPFDKGNEREFHTYKSLYNTMLNLTPGIDNDKWKEVAADLEMFPDKFKSKEDFCKYATVDEICTLLNKNHLSL
jgi:hypothetical protein